MGELEVGNARGPESGVQVLPAYHHWTEAIEFGRVEMEADDGGDRSHHVACQGGLRPCSGIPDSADREEVRLTATWMPPVNSALTSTRRLKSSAMRESVARKPSTPPGVRSGIRL